MSGCGDDLVTATIERDPRRQRNVDRGTQARG
jgi:hypothetical protein